MRVDNLTEKQRLSLSRLLAYTPVGMCGPTCSRRSSVYCRAYNSPGWAAKFFDARCKRAMRSGFDSVKKFVCTERAHRELPLNCFRAKKQFSSEVIQSLHYKAKVTLALVQVAMADEASSRQQRLGPVPPNGVPHWALRHQACN
jgi:transposase